MIVLLVLHVIKIMEMVINMHIKKLLIFKLFKGALMHV